MRYRVMKRLTESVLGWGGCRGRPVWCTCTHNRVGEDICRTLECFRGCVKQTWRLVRKSSSLPNEGQVPKPHTEQRRDSRGLRRNRGNQALAETSRQTSAEELRGNLYRRMYQCLSWHILLRRDEVSFGTKIARRP